MSRGSAPSSIGLLRRATDFERVLRTRPRVLSAHFAVHHLASDSEAVFRKVKGVSSPKLSTEAAAPSGVAVDDCPAAAAAAAAVGPEVGPAGSAGAARGRPHVRFGAVVPKRHARRAVTRNLVKRQMRAAFQARAARLASGIWLVRLRSGYDRAQYPSATSTALRRAVREELDRLLDGCADTPPAAA